MTHSLPPAVLADVESTLEEGTGHPTRIRDASPLGGGCINPSARLTTEEGDAYFLKWNDGAPPEMFEAEADGLRALARPGSLRVPEVLGWGGQGTRDHPGWLLLEFVPAGVPGRDYGRRLGEGLASLHSWSVDQGAGESTHGSSGNGPATEDSFGWHRDNFIGSLPQENTESRTWAEFWRDRRLVPQLRIARENGYFAGEEGRTMDGLLGGMETLLPGGQTGPPAILHGDLWSGNYYPGPDGGPVLIDPAVYRGDGEVDLAMMELFGSLPRGFREVYSQGRRISPAYDRGRRDLYQLYYLLVHLNLFGGSYLGSSLAAARRVLEGL